ncbi:hypothetical protein RHGRI_035584 [Rhododendron griersonianum]|uniref:Protein TIC 20 n=1 Tax=Rhododendron griersonianum TaxID=479676 RepID=A0AAV6HJS3_9ERIC|nr:hypothetical protein RHGRI_035584 [Rhododendron griersonianum]
MILNGSSLVTPSISPKVFTSKSCFSGSYGSIPPLPSCVSYRSIRSSWKPFQGLTLQSSIGNTPLQHRAAALTPLFSGNDGSFSCSTIPTVGRRKLRPFLAPPRSSIEMPWSIRYPASKGEKVKWWWRTLACLPYIISLRDTWKYWEAAYRLYPSLEQFEFLTSRFYQAFDRLPRWFVMVYFTAAYLGVVRRKELPHFLRFNTVMSMLLENCIQIAEIASTFLPFAIFGGRTGYQHFWIGLGVIYVLTVLVCMGSSILGMYVEVPGVSEAAFIHTKM